MGTRFVCVRVRAHVFQQCLMAASSGLHLDTNVWLLLYLILCMCVCACAFVLDTERES